MRRLQRWFRRFEPLWRSSRIRDEIAEELQFHLDRRIRPVVGRRFTEDENNEGRNYVAAISDRLWRTRFADDRQILGRTLRINDEPYSIVAVMPDVIPEWMESGRAGRIDVWTPLAFSSWWSESSRGSHGTSALARLRPGVSLEQAQAELSAIAAGLALTHPVDRNIGVLVRRLADTRVGALGPMLFLRRHWSSPIALTLKGDQFMPWGAYDSAGLLRIGTFDRQYDAANHMYGYSLSTETSAGTLTFTTTELTTARSDPTTGDRWFARSPNPKFPFATTFLGDYSNIAAFPSGGIAAYWTDMRQQACFGARCGHGEDAFYATAP
jgi:hypothetical protein